MPDGGRPPNLHGLNRYNFKIITRLNAVCRVGNYQSLTHDVCLFAFAWQCLAELSCLEFFIDLL